MLVVIPVCEKDVRLVLQNLAWLKKLSQKPVFECRIHCEHGFDYGQVAMAASEVFNPVILFQYDKWEGDTHWPVPQNWAWQAVARQQMSQPWLWWEADATPLKFDWLEQLLELYQKGGLPFLGASTRQVSSKIGNVEYMAGVGIYPPNVGQYSVNSLLTRGSPFDVVLGQSIFPQLVTPANDLIQHIPTRNPMTFRTVEDVKKTVLETAVLYHPCKDGSMIDVLSGAERQTITRTDDNTVILPLRCRLDDYTGYGQVSTELILNLLKIEEKEGFRLEIFPEAVEYEHSKIPKRIEARLAECPKVSPHRWEVIFNTLVVDGTRITPGIDTLFWSMWESSRVPDASIKMLHRASHVIVPNQWFGSCLTAQGLSRPIHLVPLGIQLENFPPRMMPKGPFTVGTAGRFCIGGVRKGVHLVHKAFQMAFGDRQDVRLRIKCAWDEPMEDLKDSRVDVVQKQLTTMQMHEWYASLHVYASGSSCEGWGRHQQEAMATGRPVIGVNFGGITEFWNPTNGYAVDYDIAEGQGVYKGNGSYAWPRVESMAEQMIMASMKPHGKTHLEKGLSSAFSAQQFPSSNMAEKLVKLLKELRYI